MLVWKSVREEADLSDALSRHLKGCRVGEARTTPEERVTGSRPRRACYRCARLKVKCDFGRPCHRCISQGMTCFYSGNLNQQSHTLRQPASNSPGASNAGDGVSSPSTTAIPQTSPQPPVEDSDLLPITAAGGPAVGSDRFHGDSQCDLERMAFAQELGLANYLSWDLNVPSLPLFPAFIVDGAPDFMLELEQHKHRQVHI
ncbi:putative pas domain-containing protein [Fusarium mundagurra]|uniref:Putative pas domain-containing protein n=1 Tax=Fusarium mundagurra TaxID=1567541 RepID=A0A8H5YP01_9HYPO|nr:putative pas domain-containing protein [Fusarium mundagurra]